MQATRLKNLPCYFLSLFSKCSWRKKSNLGSSWYLKNWPIWSSSKFLIKKPSCVPAQDKHLTTGLTLSHVRSLYFPPRKQTSHFLVLGFIKRRKTCPLSVVHPSLARESKWNSWLRWLQAEWKCQAFRVNFSGVRTQTGAVKDPVFVFFLWTDRSQTEPWNRHLRYGKGFCAWGGVRTREMRRKTRFQL